MMIPKPLLPGDTVALIGVSGAIREPDLDAVVRSSAQKLEALGFRVKIDSSVYGQYGYLSGTDRERADAFNRVFADDTIDGVFCIKGGYGCIRMLEYVDWDMISRHPKAFVGLSDITSLHTALHSRCGLCTFHGPMPLSGDYEGMTRDSLMHALSGQPDPRLENFNGTSLGKINGGIAEGQLVGGNLSLIVAGTGTRFDLDVRDKLLFLEDVGERTYTLDRYFHQLYLAGKLTECAGVILGGFTNCVVEYPEYGLTVEEVLRDVFAHTSVPVITGLQAGHLHDMLTLPLGRTYRMDADQGVIELIG